MRVIRATAAMLASLCCGGCAGAQSALDPGGTVAMHLLWLITLIVPVCTIVWLAVMTALAASLLKRRPSGSADPQLLPDSAVERRMSIIVAAAVGLTVLIISAFTALSFAATRGLSLNGPDPLLVEVRGYQWWWEVTYHDRAGDQPLVTANEIHLPVGRPVKIKLTAADVIHSFWVPNLAGKQDLIPGRNNTITLNAARPGLYRGQCAEFCGFQHAHMAMLVVAQPEAEFESWRAAQRTEASSPSDPEQTLGHDVFESKACSACHTVRGTKAVGKLGPDLTHVASRKFIAAGLLETTRGSLAAWTADPQTLKPGNNMPQVSLTADELLAVSAYLANLQ